MPFSVLYLVASGLLWGTGGVTGTLLGRAAGLSAISVAAWRLLAGGGLIVVVRTVLDGPQQFRFAGRAHVASFASDERCRITRQGLPTATTLAGMSFSLTAIFPSWECV